MKKGYLWYLREYFKYRLTAYKLNKEGATLAASPFVTPWTYYKQNTTALGSGMVYITTKARIAADAKACAQA